MSEDRPDRRAKGRLSAPGRLSNAGSLSGVTVLEAENGRVEEMLPAGPLEEFATQHGLRPSAQRPPVKDYIRQLRARWNFILAFATARNIAMYTEAKLGQLGRCSRRC